MAGHVAGLFANLATATQYDVFHRARVELRILLKQRVYSMCDQFSRTGRTEGAPVGFSQPGTDAIDDNYVFHDEFSMMNILYVVRSVRFPGCVASLFVRQRHRRLSEC